MNPSTIRNVALRGMAVAFLYVFLGSLPYAHAIESTTSTTPAAPLTCDTTSASSTFTGCYYDNQDFTNLKVVRTDPAVNFDFGGGSPDPSIASDTFSVRWNGNFVFDGSPYEFTAVTDDGMRVFIDGTLVLDKFFDQSPTTYTFTRTMTAGTHHLRVEYYENSGQSVAKLSWKKVTLPPTLNCDAVGTNAFAACYYDNQDFTNLKVVRTDPAVNFDFGGGSPDPIIESDTFSARWNGNFTFDSSTYEFAVTADDGVRVFIDGTVVLDKFFDQPPTTYTFNRVMTAGTHNVKVEYFEHFGGAVAKLSWKKVTPPPPVLTCDTVGTDAFTGCYYDNQDFTNLKVVRTDPAINFDFGGGSPDPTIESDTFSSRWDGNFTLEAGDYNFTAVTDDGMRVFIDGTLVLDKFFDQPPTTYNFSRTLSAGTHRIRVEYFENSGGAVAKLSWQKVTTTGLRIINPLNGSDVSGIVDVKAVVDGRALNTYTIGWRTNGGGFTPLIDDASGMFKHNFIDFGPWNWRSDNNYPLEFQAKDLGGTVIGTMTIIVHVVH